MAAPSVLEEPHVGFGIPRLTGGPDDAQGRKIMARDPIGPMRHEGPYRRGGDAQMRDAVALAEGPQAIWLRIVRRALEEQHGATQEQGAGDEQRSHKPAEVG